MNWSQMSVFKMPSKYRRYNFQPRYYNERKEALKKKIEREARITDSPSLRDIKFKAELEQTWGNTDRKSQVLKSNLRLLVILILIMCAVYYVFVAMDGAEEIINNALEE
jgi:hypothetical protein